MAGEIRGTASPEHQPRRRFGRIRTFSSLRNRDYRFLWVGNTFNSGANWLQQLTVGWLVWDLSHSPFLVGTVGGLRAFPFLFIGPFAGVMADRLDRRKLVLLSQSMLAVTAFLFALLVASGQVQVWHAFAYIIVSGTAHAILQPTRSALVANTVPREDLPNAFALQSMSVTSSRFVWPAIGGILVGAFGFKFNFFVESALYVVLALLIIPVRTPYREQSRRRHASGLADMKEGIIYVWQDKLILQLILLSFIPNFFVQPCIHLLPVFAGEVLNRGPEIFGTLLSANGVAGFTATLIIASVGFILGKGQASLLTLVLSSVGVVLLGLSHWLFLSVVAVVVIGFAGSTFRTSNNTLVQTLVPDALRGRVQSIYHLDHGLTPLASFFIGLFAEFFTPTRAVTVVGLASLALSLYFLLAFRRVRRLP
jgi:MFS family permease